MKEKYWLTFIIIAHTIYVAQAQSTVKHLSLPEAITASVANNNAVKLSALDVQVANEKLRQADAIFLPQADFSYTAVTTNNPLNAFGFKLQQGSISGADFDPKLLNNPSTTSDFSAKVELKQPLLNMDMIYQRKNAAAQVEMHQYLFKRSKEYISFETEKVYLQLQMAYDVDKVMNEALNTSRAFYKVANDYYNQGLIQKPDMLNAQVNVVNNETQVNSSLSAIQDISDLLSTLMGKDVGTVYTTDSSGIINGMNGESYVLYNDRPDFKALEKAMESYDLMIRSSKLSYLPKLNAFANYQWNDKSPLGFDANSYFAGIQLSWNIFNGNRTKHTVSQHYLEKEKIATQLDAQKDEAFRQINQARRQLYDASYAIKGQQLAIDQAAEALRVLQNRYAQGLVKTADVLMAQTQLSQQKIGYTKALYNYNLAAITLQFLTTNK